MSRRLIFFVSCFALLLLAMWFGVKIHDDPGYILIAYNKTSIETSLWFGVVVLAIIYVVVNIVWRLIYHALIIGTHFQSWRDSRNATRSLRLTSAGLCDLSEGYFKLAEKKLLKGTKGNSEPLVNYLNAARAAQGQQNFKQRDEYLKLAFEANKNATFAIGITQAQLQISANQWEEAVATLKYLYKKSSKHPLIIELLTRVYISQKDWQPLNELLPKIRKQKILSLTEIEKIEENIFLEQINEAAKSDTPGKSLTKAWGKLPKAWRQDNKLLCLLIDKQTALHNEESTAPLIEQALKKQWEPTLVTRYGTIRSENPKKQLNTAEKWLRDHPNDPVLLLCLGKLCQQQKLWGKAKEYLEQCVQLNPSAEGYQALGEVCEALNQSDIAMECYHKGLKLQNQPISIDHNQK